MSEFLSSYLDLSYEKAREKAKARGYRLIRKQEFLRRKREFKGTHIYRYEKVITITHCYPDENGDCVLDCDITRISSGFQKNKYIAGVIANEKAFVYIESISASRCVQKTEVKWNTQTTFAEKQYLKDIELKPL